ncbi:MAG: cytochrome c family protein [Hyphomicrobiales bacterium]
MKINQFAFAFLAGLAASAVLAPAFADADVAAGETEFKKCAVCHSGAEKKNKVGPWLAGIVGRPVASVEGYAYSQGMKDFAAKTPAWTEEVLNTYLKDPKGTVPGTKMTFAGEKDDAMRANLIGYLKTLAP